MDDIPAFLIIPQGERAASWKDRKLTTVRSKREKSHGWQYPKTMTPEAWAMVRAAEADRERKKAERLAYLRSLKE